MKKILSILFLLFILSVPAWATSYYVCTSGTCNGVSGSDSNNGTTTSTPWLTNTHVNAQSFSAGDVINLAGTSSVELIPPSAGSNGSPITFQQWAGQSAWTITGGQAIARCVYIAQQYVSIANVNCSNTTSEGIMTAVSNTIINGVTSNGNVNPNSGGSAYNDIGIAIICSTDCTGDVIENSTANNNGGAGIENEGNAVGAKILNNIVTGNGTLIAEEGIEVYYVSSPGPTGTIVENNTISATIQFGGAEGNGIETDNNSTGSVVAYNLTFSNQGAGIVNNGVTGNNFYYNLIYNNTLDGIDANSLAINSNIYNNTIVNGVNGIYLYTPGSTGDNIKNNIISGASAYGIEIGDSGTPASEDYNNVYNSGTANFKNISQGAHDITTNPLFTGSSNYILKYTSPALNAGTNVGLTSDILGNIVPNSGISMGAYQNSSSISNQWYGTLRGSI